MASGEVALPIQEYPDEFEIVTFSVDPGTSTNVPIFLTDRIEVIDSIVVRYEANNSGALTGQVAYVPDASALAAGTEVVITSNTVDFNTTAATKYAWTMDATKNKVPANSMVYIKFSGAAGAALGVVTVTMRIRSCQR